MFSSKKCMFNVFVFEKYLQWFVCGFHIGLKKEAKSIFKLWNFGSL